MAQSSGDTIAQRISLEGDDEVVRRLQRIEQTVSQLGQSQDAMAGTIGTGFAALNESTNATINRMGGLRQSVSSTHAEFTVLGKATENFRGQLAELGRFAVPAFSGFLGAGGLAAVAGLFIKAGSDSAHYITSLKNVALTTGFSEEAVAGLRKEFEEVGLEGDTVNDMLVKFSQHMGDARAKSLDLNSALTGGVSVMKGIKNAADAASGSVSVLRGNLKDGPILANAIGGPTVIRGGQEPGKLDIANPAARFFAVTGKRATEFPDTMAGNQKALEAFIAGLIKLHQADSSLANAIGVAEFGKRFKAEYAGIEAAFKSGGLEEAIHKAEQAGLVPTSDQKAAAAEYTKSIAELDNSWKKFGSMTLPMVARGLTNITSNIQNTGNAVGPYKEMLSSLYNTIARGDVAGLQRGFEAAFGKIDLSGLGKRLVDDFTILGQQSSEGFMKYFKMLGPDLGEAINNSLTNLPSIIDTIKQTFQPFTDWLGQQLSAAWDGFSSAAERAISYVGDKLKSVIGFLGQSLSGQSQSANSSSGTIPGVPDYSNAMGLTGFAGGGRVAGSGFGDRIRALLEPGEFVIRRAVVDAMGADFFAALNGGMGSLFPRTGFATGGMVYPTYVTPTPGSQVHFWLGNDRFDLQGDDNTVSALIRRASSERTLRAGSYPGWYGGGR